VLWEVNLGSQVSGFPVSFGVNGRQYIAVSTGQGVNTGGQLMLTPDIRVGNTNALYVFALPEGAENGRATVRLTTSPTTFTAAPPPLTGMPNCRDVKQTGTASLANPLSPEGRFSHEQGEAGRKLLVEQQCVNCHGPTLGGTPGAPPLNDVGFRGAWQGRSVEALFSCTKSTMPPGRAGTLTDAQYIELIAAILEANGIKPGTALPTDTAALGRIVMEERK
jgi:mono/diheme cytochrome c family protein